MKTKTIILRQFQECSKELQETILNNYRDINVEDVNIYENNDTHMQNLADKGFLNPTVYYDLSCCQGSGACFVCSEFELNLLLENLEIKHKTWLINIIKNYCEIELKENHLANFYTHENTVNFDIITYFQKDFKRIEKHIDIIKNYIEKIRLEACRELYNNLSNDYDFLRSDEQVKETLIANEYYFNEQGKIEEV